MAEPTQKTANRVFVNPSTNREAPKRVTRATVAGNRSNRPTCGSPIVSLKTKNVVAFLCLFDGLRTPSIRRLVRKPRTICGKPLLTFDPSFYAPSSTQALSDLYRNSLNCPSEIVVDPSVQTVLELLRKHASSIPPHRVVLHYFGHGCYPPSDGNIYFFSDDRQRYKPLKIATLMNSCACPVTVVMDCANAAAASKLLGTKRDTFAFFACGAGESLPLSTSTPLDLFSCCLFDPFTAAMWYKGQKHCDMFSTCNCEDDGSTFQTNQKQNTQRNIYNNNYNTCKINHKNIYSNIHGNYNTNNQDCNYNNNYDNLHKGVNQNNIYKTGFYHKDLNNKMYNTINSNNANNNEEDCYQMNNCLINNENLEESVNVQNPESFINREKVKTLDRYNEMLKNTGGSNEYKFDDNYALPKIANKKFLKGFLMAVLESICFETQDKATFDLFTKDSATATMFKGFALSQRVMMSYNLHPSSIPDLRPMMTSVLWNFWDIALDASITMSKDGSKKVIFDMFIKTFTSYPSNGILPLFAFFIIVPEFHEECASRLFAYIDENDEAAALEASRTNIAKAILSYPNPSAASLAIVSKIIATSNESPFILNTPTFFVLCDDPSVVSIGMAVVTLAASIEYQQQFKRLAELCIEHAIACAPFSMLLFGILMDKSSKTAYFEDFTYRITPLLEDSRPDVRASTIYALNFSKNPDAVQYIINLTDDKSPMVRIQCMYSLLVVYKLVKQPIVFDRLNAFEKDDDPSVVEHFKALKPTFPRAKLGHNESQIIAANPIIRNLFTSIKNSRFESRFDSNLFGNIPIPQPVKIATTLESRVPRIGTLQLDKPTE
ncbi:hypothetical protein TRFO_10215 [Tritrichomonas foetus]|uniref:Raptor N-terminal CASPase-like domain-containing protein n=1 Tax=Tritrichomonas foetus TaxID=1144522 RepID=A0A1J4JA16_9EUKA|nr:hypothetical protein TRFO_10215 [Tritrichomonas foetus]|eukprot:OHS96034.1 hypothetical protein TRFO_10215 [Tritrichomonas foetus]